MNGPKVDEVLCKTLKRPTSETMFHGLAIDKIDLFSTRNRESQLSIMCLRAETREEEEVETGGFASHPEADYIPPWTRMSDSTNYSSLEVFMSSESNYVFNIASKSETKIAKEPFHSILPSFDVHNIQVLLNKNLYFALKDSLVFVADFLQVDPNDLQRAIKLRRTTDGGWIASLSAVLMNGKNLKQPYVGIREMEPRGRRPMFGIKSQTESCWSYETQGYASQSLLLHLLFNTQPVFQQHWAKPLLLNTKEIALILPRSTKKWAKNILVCVIYRDKGHVWVKQFQELDCMVGLPFQIGNYYTKAQQEQRGMLL